MTSLERSLDQNNEQYVEEFNSENGLCDCAKCPVMPTCQEELWRGGGDKGFQGYTTHYS